MANLRNDGEYLLKSDGILFGVINDNRFLLKKPKSLSSYCLCEEIPYPGAKTSEK